MPVLHVCIFLPYFTKIFEQCTEETPSSTGRCGGRHLRQTLMQCAGVIVVFSFFQLVTQGRLWEHGNSDNIVFTCIIFRLPFGNYRDGVEQCLLKYGEGEQLASGKWWPGDEPVSDVRNKASLGDVFGKSLVVKILQAWGPVAVISGRNVEQMLPLLACLKLPAG